MIRNQEKYVPTVKKDETLEVIEPIFLMEIL